LKAQPFRNPRSIRLLPRLLGIYSAICGAVKLFEILQGGLQTPLGAVQTAGLFDAGCLDQQTQCTPIQPTQWLTIDALFPPLNYDTSREFVGRSPAARSSFRLSLPAAMALVPLAAITTAVIGYLFFGAQPSKASPIVKSTVSQTAVSSPALAKQRLSKPQVRSKP